jgi:hypothetical protein
MPLESKSVKISARQHRALNRLSRVTGHQLSELFRRAIANFLIDEAPVLEQAYKALADKKNDKMSHGKRAPRRRAS